MKKIDNFVNVYPVTKTLRFKLIPVGKTKENFDKEKLLDADKEMAENYKKAKVIIDKYYNEFINNCLNNFNFKSKPDNLKTYYEIWNSEIDKKEKINKIKELQGDLRKEIVSAFSNTETKKNIYDKLFKGDLLNEILEDKRITDEEKEIISKFDRFTTYFQGFFQNRKNMFSDEEKVGSISYRCVNENLKTFVSNVKAYNDKIKDALKGDIKTLEEEYKDIIRDFRINDIFSIDYYNLCLTGDDINKYNKIIGGFSKDEKTKIKGLNEYINLYNQINKDKPKLPKFKQLYKQILSDDKNETFRFDVIEDDKMVHDLIDSLLTEMKKNDLDKVKSVFEGFSNSEYDNDNIYIHSKMFTELSVKCFDNYNVIKLGIENEYDNNHKIGKDKGKYENNKDKFIKSIEYLSIEKICCLVENIGYDRTKIHKVICEEITNIINDAVTEYNSINKRNNIRNDEKIIEKIKNLLDSLLNLYRYKEAFCKYDETEKIDLTFYGELGELDFLNNIISIYNKIRNYLTKKPYKLDKIKLNFNCPYLLSGWSTDFKTNSTVIIKSNNKYYLMICTEKLNNDDLNRIKNADSCNSIYYDYIYQKPDNKNIPRLFIRSKGDKFAPAVDLYKLPVNEIIEIYDNKWFTTSESKSNYKRFKESLIRLIDYFKLGFRKHESFKVFEFKWKESDQYSSIDKFYNDVISSCYKLETKEINFDEIIHLTEIGKAHLFQIYNKDFSLYSKGNKNLHTLYFEQLFSAENLNNVVYKLNGEAEIFFREKSLEYKVTHPKNKAISNKNANNNKSESIFEYDLIKDKRFTSDQFEFHVPITINFKADGGIYNDKVNEAINNCNDNYVIGIDRGERNLIYVSVVSEKNGLIEQMSLNDIVNEYNGNIYNTDYHELLNKKEKERDDAKKSWKTISNIKELKEGYVSQVVHKICELVEKYDAIIVMEDLTKGFKNSRTKVEKQVYQKFEKMLIDKLNLYINKKHKANEKGGLLKGYQLTRPYESNNKMFFQNGFIFYVAPWNTSKIDPTTGFVNLFRLSNYTTIESRKAFINKFDSIKYNKASKIFEFSFSYKNFDYGTTDFNNTWSITSYGKRILTFRNKDKNNNFDYKEIYLTEELINLFDKYKVDYEDADIKELILNVNEKDFYDKLFSIFKLILQMRNSKPKLNDNDSVVDCMSSPVKNKRREYYNSNDVKEGEKLPIDADANGAYNIARKGLMIVERIKNGQNDKLTVISNKEWLEYAQTHLPI